MTEKKAIKAAMRLKKYCKSFESCGKGCIFRDLNKYDKSGCMLREGVPPEEYDEISESGGNSGNVEE